MRRLNALMLSDGSKEAFGPPISVRTQPGLTTTQVMPRGARSIARPYAQVDKNIGLARARLWRPVVRYLGKGYNLEREGYSCSIAPPRTTVRGYWS